VDVIGLGGEQGGVDRVGQQAALAQVEAHGGAGRDGGDADRSCSDSRGDIGCGVPTTLEQRLAVGAAG